MSFLSKIVLLQIYRLYIFYFITNWMFFYAGESTKCHSEVAAAVLNTRSGGLDKLA